MATDAPPDPQGASTRPYLIRALHEWCTDHGFTPYIAVFVDGGVQVPTEYVKNHEIVLNVGFDATQGLKLGNELIEFRARFGGVARDIAVPVDHVVAIYARENGQGMAFPTPSTPPPVVGPATLGGVPVATRPPPSTPSLRLAPASSSAASSTGSPAPIAGASLGVVAPPASPSTLASMPLLPPPTSKPTASPTGDRQPQRDQPAARSDAPEGDPPVPSGPGRPTLKRIK
jgi:stringent starvation protein B